jgi:hypothetical protein
MAQETRAMLTIYKAAKQGLGVLDEVARNCWIHLANPTPQKDEWALTVRG